jgi:CBS domain-containing protein
MEAAAHLTQGRTTLSSVTDLTESAVARRVPSMTDERLRGLSRRQPVTVPPGTSLADCVRAIQRTGTGDSVFVCDAAGELKGVLTERDIFARIVVGHVDLSQPVEALMTTEPHTLDLDQTIRDAIELMQTGRYRNVPIVDEDRRLVGVVRQVDIIKYLAESFPEELLNLPPRPHQRMRQPEGG